MSKDAARYFHLVHTMLGALAEEGVEVKADRVPVSRTPYVVVGAKDFESVARLREAFVLEMVGRGFFVTAGQGYLQRRSEKGSFLMEIPRIFFDRSKSVACLHASIDGPYEVDQKLLDRPVNVDKERRRYHEEVEEARRSREENASRSGGYFASSSDRDAYETSVADVGYSGGRRNKRSQEFFGDVEEALRAASEGRMQCAVQKGGLTPASYIRARMDAEFDDISGVRSRFVEAMKAAGFEEQGPGRLWKSSEAGNYYLSIGSLAASEAGDAFVDIEPYGPVRSKLEPHGYARNERLERMLFESRRRDRSMRPDEEADTPKM